MLVLKVAPVFLLALIVGAEKKIELQDIEEDNLKSEKEKQVEKNEARISAQGSGGLLPLDFLKNGLLRYFENPIQGTQQSRYVQQYAVTEQPERGPVVAPKPQYSPPATQQAMVGYLSNVPMQIYLVPQYYNDQSEHAASAPSSVQYTAPGVSRVPAYQTAPEAVQQQTNYIEVPTYVTPTGKAYIQQYSSPVAYVTYAQPTVAPAQGTGPVVAYQMPVVQYPTSIAAPPVAPKGYYHQYTESNSVDEGQEEVDNKQYATQTEGPYNKYATQSEGPYNKYATQSEGPYNKYATQSEGPYGKPSVPEYPRYYNSRAPYRDEHRHSSVSELPPPNPLLLKGPPSHLAHLPKALPMYRPLTKPVYAAGGSLISSAYTQRPSEAYGVPFRRRPSSLLDSYIPSGLQLEYLKRGYSKDPLSVYEALSSGRHFHHPSVSPRHYERGFLPNQMYHTAAGGVTYGHYKRSPKQEKVPQK